MPISRRRPKREPCKRCNGRKWIGPSRKDLGRICPDCTVSTGKKRKPIK